MNGDFYDKVSLPEDQGDGIKLADDAINEKYVDTREKLRIPDGSVYRRRPFQNHGNRNRYL